MMENEEIEMNDLPTPESDFNWDNFLPNDDHIEETTFTKDNDEVLINFDEENIENIRIKNKIKYTEDFFINILELEESCTDTNFINFMLENKILTVNRVSSSGDWMINDYTIKYLGSEFRTTGRALTDEENTYLRKNIRGDYDDYINKKIKKALKKAGVITAVGLSLIAIITGLSVGLTRKGNDLVYQSKKWKKLNPSEPKDKIPWTELTDAAGKSLIFTGRYLTVILTVTGSYLVVKKWKKKKKKKR